MVMSCIGRMYLMSCNERLSLIQLLEVDNTIAISVGHVNIANPSMSHGEATLRRLGLLPDTAREITGILHVALSRLEHRRYTLPVPQLDLGLATYLNEKRSIDRKRPTTPDAVLIHSPALTIPHCIAILA